MKQKLIFLTTAITRRHLQKETIGKFYEKYFNLLNTNYELHHIINIDMPLALRNGWFKYIRTKELFIDNIPNSVKLYFVIDQLESKPSFKKAYNKVLEELKKNNILDTNTLVWWLEDDWEVINNTNFVPLLKLLNINTNGAMSLCDKAPMCSFRGGPIMNYSFFKNFFENYNPIHDPEITVARSIRFNQNIPMYDNDIYIVLLYMKNDIKSYPINMNHSCFWWYDRKYVNTIKIKPGKTFRYIIGIVDNNKINFKESTNARELTINNNEINNLTTFTLDNLKDYLEKKSAISYISIYPHIFRDIGRKFNAENNLTSPKGQK